MRPAEEITEGNAKTEHDKSENNFADMHDMAAHHAHAGAVVPTVTAHLVQFLVKLVQFVVKFRLSGKSPARSSRAQGELSCRTRFLETASLAVTRSTDGRLRRGLSSGQRKGPEWVLRA